MAVTVLNDKNVYPSDEVIFSHIGKYSRLWTEFFSSVDSVYPDFTREWRYYNDGKSWLMKVQYKAKTVFWLSLADGSFRATFYLAGKAEGAVMESGISHELKEQFMNRDMAKKNHGLTVIFRKKKDVEQAMLLCKLKLSCR